MDFKQSTLGEILDSERDMVLRAYDRFGPFYANAQELQALLSSGFIKSVHGDRFIFAMFLAMLNKHLNLALFSALRLHHAQAMLNMRHVLEAGACAAYAIANIDPKDFADTSEDGVLDPTQDLAKKRNAWLEKNFKDGSDVIKRLKGIINESSAHANVVDAQNNFRADFEAGRFSAPFFDIEDEMVVKTDLWFTANLARGFMDLFYGVNAKFNGFVIQEGWGERFGKLAKDNEALKAEMIKHERLRRFAK